MTVTVPAGRRRRGRLRPGAASRQARAAAAQPGRQRRRRRSINTIAEVTFYGRDQAGNEVTRDRHRSPSTLPTLATLTRSERTRAVTFLKSRAIPVALVALAAIATRRLHRREDRAAAARRTRRRPGCRCATSVTPDILDQDGALAGRARGGRRAAPMAARVGSIPLRVEIALDGVIQDFGTAVQQDRGHRQTTASPGSPTRRRRARPSRSTRSRSCTLVVTPIGSDFHGANSRFVELRLVPRGVILPPNGAPVPSFTITPTPVTTLHAGDLRRLGHTRRRRAVRRCAASTRGTSATAPPATGIVVTHEFRTPGTFVVRLTVTDARGTSATTLASRSPSTPTRGRRRPSSPSRRPTPTAGRTSSSTPQASTRGARPHASSPTTGTSAPAAPAPGVTITKGYDTPGTYNVTLKVHRRHVLAGRHGGDDQGRHGGGALRRFTWPLRESTICGAGSKPTRRRLPSRSWPRSTGAPARPRRPFASAAKG